VLPTLSPNSVDPVILLAMTVAIVFLIVVIAARLNFRSTLFGGRFTARPLLNYSEQKLYGYLQRYLQPTFGTGAKLMCQVLDPSSISAAPITHSSGNPECRYRVTC